MIIVPDPEAYIKEIAENKKSTPHGEWYDDITKTVDKGDHLVKYISARRILVDDSGNPIKTKSGAYKRETRKGSSRSLILEKEKA